MIPTPEILAEIVRTQAERRKNWPTVYEPADPDLERVHMAKLMSLQLAMVDTKPHWGRKNAGPINSHQQTEQK